LSQVLSRYIFQQSLFSLKQISYKPAALLWFITFSRSGCETMRPCYLTTHATSSSLTVNELSANRT